MVKIQVCFVGMLLGVITSSTVAQEKVSFGGRWFGPWKNSNNDTGEDWLILKEDGKSLKGTWGDVTVEGMRKNANTFELEGKTSSRNYSMIGTFENDAIKLTYIVSKRGEPGSYKGTAHLTRKKKK